ncbi:MAG: hypothetical protein ACE5EC_07335 [Phycisphaerae bacterium]
MNVYGHNDEDSDPDAPLPQDLIDDGDALPEMMCPNCRGLICEDTQKCPHCGDWIPAGDPPGSRRRVRRWAFLAAVVLMLLAMWRYLLY